MREETRCRHIGYSSRLTARVLLHAPSHRQDSTYHGLWYTSHGALAGTRNSSMGPPHERSIRRPSRGALVGTRNSLMGPPHERSNRRPITPWANALTMELCSAPTTNSRLLPPTLMKQWTNIFFLIIISELKFLCWGITQHSFLNI